MLQGRACCWSAAPSNDVQDPEGSGEDPTVQRLFGVGLHTRFTCAESGEAEEEDATAFELKCNITSDVNLLSEGLRLGLVSDREKNSAALGRLALFQVPTSTLCLHCFLCCLLPHGLLVHALVCTLRPG